MRTYPLFISALVALLALAGCGGCGEGKTVLAIPVYGQSLALGEEAVRVTDFDSLYVLYNGAIVTERLDDKFGYFSEDRIKQHIKRLMRDRSRSFELSVYGMSAMVMEEMQKKRGIDSVMICTFPGGKGKTSIVDLGRGSEPYGNFIKDISKAYKKASRKGWKLVVPAVCWMHGENDVARGTSEDYKRDLIQIHSDMDADIRCITGQQDTVVFICYQTNCITLSEDEDGFDPESFDCRETAVPQAQMELVRDHPYFMASGPTYPYSFARERVHIDGVSQIRLGHMEGLSVLRLLEGNPSRGLTPVQFTISGDTVAVSFNVPSPPMVVDTVSVWPAEFLGFSVISPANENIIREVIFSDCVVKIVCDGSPAGCKVRYGVNGEKEKSGYMYGPRGNIRDSQGEYCRSVMPDGSIDYLHNWCYQFDVLLGTE